MLRSVPSWWSGNEATKKLNLIFIIIIIVVMWWWCLLLIEKSWCWRDDMWTAFLPMLRIPLNILLRSFAIHIKFADYLIDHNWCFIFFIDEIKRKITNTTTKYMKWNEINPLSEGKIFLLDFGVRDQSFFFLVKMRKHIKYTKLKNQLLHWWIHEIFFVDLNSGYIYLHVIEWSRH